MIVWLLVTTWFLHFLHSKSIKNQRRALLWGQPSRGKSLQALGMSGLYSWLLAVNHWKVVPQSTCYLNGAQSCGPMKMAKAFIAGVSAKLRTWVGRLRFESRYLQGAFSMESPLSHSYFLWFIYIISTHLWDVLPYCTFPLQVRDVTWNQ